MTDKDESINSFYWEESNTQLDGALSDLKNFKQCCDALRNSLHHTSEQKTSGEKINTTNFVTLLMNIKELNRRAQFRIRKARDHTLEQKLNLDKLHLNLQNFLYEVAHLENEITTCLEFKSQHERIRLIPVEEFYEVTGRTPHSLSSHEETLERLYWELEQRKSLSQACNELKKSVNAATEEIVEKREYLTSFGPKLKELSESTFVAQEMMKLPFTKEETQYSMAFLLPAPLYLVYSRMKSYITVTGRSSSLSVEIVGDAQLAKAVNETIMEANARRPHSLPVDGSTGMADADSDGDDTTERKKRKMSRHRSKPASSTSSNSTSHLTSLYPLSVVLSLTQTTSSTAEKACCVRLTLSFSWIPSVGLVTVRMLFEPLPDSGSACPKSQSANDLLNSEALLSNLLLTSETRTSSSSADLPLLPSTAKERLDRYQWDASGPTGRPYAWAQQLCGSHCLPEHPPNSEDAIEKPEASSSKSASCAPFGQLDVWLQALEKRLDDRIALCSELEAIEAGRPLLSAEQQALLPPSFVSEQGAYILNWRRATFAQLQAIPRAQVPISLGLIQATDFIFKCQFRPSTPRTTTTVWVSVPTEYPETAALLMVEGLDPEADGEKANLDLSDLHLQELEMEVNCYWSEFLSSRLHQTFSEDAGMADHQQRQQQRSVQANGSQRNILSCQVAHCAACLEVLWQNSPEESTSSLSSVAKPRDIKYPTRSRPLRYLPVTRTFTHR